MKALFMQEMLRRGYFFGRAWFITHSHTSAILGGTIAAAAKVLKTVEDGGAKLDGLPPRPVFRRNA